MVNKTQIKNRFSINFLKVSWPLLLVLLFAIVEVIHIGASSDWRSVYLYNGDSTTLAAYIKSLQYGESQQWIFSSQIFLFPEALLYSLSFLFTQSVYNSFILNSILNLVIVYFIFYWISARLIDSRLKSQLLSLLGIALICGYTLLERHASVNMSAIVTLFFFTTYYYGVILSSLLLLFLTLVTLRSTSRRNIRISYIVIALITALTAASDPLLALQFTLPYTLTLIILFFINRIKIKLASILIGLQLLGIVLAQIIRIPFKGMIGASPNSYINLQNIPQAIGQLGQTISFIATSKASMAEYVIMCGIVIIANAYVVLILYRSFRDQTYMQDKGHVLFIVLFGAISPGIIVSAIIMTGNSYTRYFLPLAFFPILSILALASRIKISILQLKIGVAAICCLFFIYCIWMLPKYQPLTQAASSDDITCFEQVVGSRHIIAAGSYWSTRALDLYSNPNKIRAIQVSPSLAPMPWLNNQADYSLTFNAVIVDRNTSPSTVGQQNVSILGTPSQKWMCSNFYVYYYDVNTQGYKTLNQQLHNRV